MGSIARIIHEHKCVCARVHLETHIRVNLAQEPGASVACVTSKKNNWLLSENHKCGLSSNVFDICV